MGSEETAAMCMSDEKEEASNTVRNASGTARHVAWGKETFVGLSSIIRHYSVLTSHSDQGI